MEAQYLQHPGDDMSTGIVPGMHASESLHSDKLILATWYGQISWPKAS